MNLVNVNITGRENTGALIGIGKAAYSDIIGCSVTGNVRGGKNTGGLIGSIGDYIRGLASNTIVIEKSYSEAEVNGYTHTGGLIGEVQYGGIDIKNCYTTGDVTGTGTSTGGLYGRSPACYYCKTTVVNSYTTGDVSSVVQGHEGKYVAGIAGSAGGLTISNSFVTGSVSGGYGTYAFARGSTSTNNYFNNHTGNPDSCGSSNCVAINDNEAYFKDSNNAPMDAWDFSNIWAIDPNINEGYPYLR